MKKILTLLFLTLLLSSMSFAQQDTVNYKLMLGYYVGQSYFSTTLDEGFFLEGEKYIVPEEELTGAFAAFNDFYDGIEHSVFWLDEGAIDENIWIDMTLGGLDLGTGWPQPQFGYPLFLNLNIDVRTHPDSPAVAGDYYFNDNTYMNYAIPKHAAFQNMMTVLNFDPNDLGFRYILASGFLGIGIETINTADSVKFRAEHLSKFGGGRGNMPNDVEIEEIPEIPVDYELEQNYPNPFNPSTTIVYGIPEEGNVTLKVYDMLGAEVETLVSDYQQAGTYRITFTANNMSSGIYLYKLQSKNATLSKKMLLVK